MNNKSKVLIHLYVNDTGAEVILFLLFITLLVVRKLQQ